MTSMRAHSQRHRCGKMTQGPMTARGESCTRYGVRPRWPLRVAIPLWIGLAVAGWAAVVVSGYSVIRHENEVAVIDKIEQPERALVRDGGTGPYPALTRDEIKLLNIVAPAGTAVADALTPSTGQVR